MFVKDALQFGNDLNEADMCVFRRTESDGMLSDNYKSKCLVYVQQLRVYLINMWLSYIIIYILFVLYYNSIL
jgi:hypothetical protein